MNHTTLPEIVVTAREPYLVIKETKFPLDKIDPNPFRIENLNFNHRVSLDPNKTVRHSVVNQLSSEMTNKLNRMPSEVNMFKEMEEQYIILLELYGKLSKTPEVEKGLSELNQLFDKIKVLYEEIIKQREKTNQSSAAANKAESDNIPKFGLSKVHKEDFDLMLSVTGSLRLWLHSVLKYRMSEINEKQKLIDMLIILKDLANQLSKVYNVSKPELEKVFSALPRETIKLSETFPNYVLAEGVGATASGSLYGYISLVGNQLSAAISIDMPNKQVLNSSDFSVSSYEIRVGDEILYKGGLSPNDKSIVIPQAYKYIGDLKVDIPNIHRGKEIIIVLNIRFTYDSGSGIVPSTSKEIRKSLIFK
ncbi:hypothetical protein ACWA5Z_12200 [Testudinibacter sp. P80/BLE/0925]|uniref:hypothetical protein n=1 Tax=Testudinibacter sp. TW-1 TaxID=3417757 RepID=UPI003D35E9B0